MAEPEPIDAEFEPVGLATAEDAAMRPPAQRRPLHKRHVTLAELGLGVVLAAVGGAVVAMAATGGSSGAATGTLAREIDMLAARAASVDAAVASLSTRVEEQTVALSARDVRDLALRGDIATLDRQLAALAGVQSSGDPSANPVGNLLARLDAVEAAMAQDAASPKTTGQMRRALMDLSADVAVLSEAQAALRSAFDRRQQAVAALEDAVERAGDEITGLRNAVARNASEATAVAMHPPAASTAANRSRMLRALSAVETAAREGKGFQRELGQLAALLPRDRDVAALKAMAREGAPSLPQLRDSFEMAARSSLRLAAQQPDDGWNWLRTTVTADGTIDRMGAYEFTEEQLRQARRSLELGDARGAAIAVGAIPGPAADPFRVWKEDAVRRSDMSEHLANLGARLGRKPA